MSYHACIEYVKYVLAMYIIAFNEANTLEVTGKTPIWFYPPGTDLYIDWFIETMSPNLPLILDCFSLFFGIKFC